MRKWGGCREKRAAVEIRKSLQRRSKGRGIVAGGGDNRGSG